MENYNGILTAVIGDKYTRNSVQKIAQRLVKVIKKDNVNKPVIIGYDRRFMADYYVRWIAEVFAGNKIVAKVFDHYTTSPQVAHAVKEEGFDYGIMITAGDKTYECGGIRIFGNDGKDISNDLLSIINKGYSSSHPKVIDYDLAVTNGLVTTYDNTKEYLKSIFKYVSKDLKTNNLKVLIDVNHGTTLENLMAIDKKYNFKKLEIINDNTDVLFENGKPSKTKDNCENFAKLVSKGRFSIGISFNEEGNQFVAVDELGIAHDYNELLPLVYDYLINIKKLEGGVVKSKSTSILINKLADKFGYSCNETRNNFPDLLSCTEANNAIVCGDDTCGIIMRDYMSSRDGLLTMLIILDAMNYSKQPLSEMITSIKSDCEYISTYVKGQIEFANRKKMTKTLAKSIPLFPYKPVSVTKDYNNKYTFEDGSFVLLRVDDDANILYYTMEFPTEIECERVVKSLKTFVTNVDTKKK